MSSRVASGYQWGSTATARSAARISAATPPHTGAAVTTRGAADRSTTPCAAHAIVTHGPSIASAMPRVRNTSATPRWISGDTSSSGIRRRHSEASAA